MKITCPCIIEGDIGVNLSLQLNFCNELEMDQARFCLHMGILTLQMLYNIDTHNPTLSALLLLRFGFMN